MAAQTDEKGERGKIPIGTDLNAEPNFNTHCLTTNIFILNV